MKPKTKFPNLNLIDIGSNIRKWRVLKGLKQAALADNLGISKVAISKIETGKTDIPVLRLLAIAEILEITIDLLMKDPSAIINANKLLVN